MADVLLQNPQEIPPSTEPSSKKQRLNWLSWMRKSLALGNKASAHHQRSKLCACGFQHTNYCEETKSLQRSVFTTQMSSQQPACGLSSSPPNSPISESASDSRSGRLLPLRPIHLASRCREEVLYTRLNRSCSINSAASTPLVPEKLASDSIAEAESDPQQEGESHIMVNLDAIEVVNNLDEARLLGNENSTGSEEVSSLSSGSSKCLSKFSSPFKRKKKSKEETFEKFLLGSPDEDQQEEMQGSGSISREELLRLFILKLDEEANYFQVSASPDEELCDCQKCQIYYCEYYEKYLEDYERRRTSSEPLQQPPNNHTSNNLEASILMDDIMNNGMTFCSIM